MRLIVTYPEVSAMAKMTASDRKAGIVPEKQDPTIRELLYKNYRIVYKVAETNIYILTIFEGHKLPPIDDLG